MTDTSEHRINLSRQWEQLNIDGNVSGKLDLSVLEQCQLPLSAKRNFHRPTGIEGKSVVRITVEPMVNGIRIWLNETETPLTATDNSIGMTEDITSNLLPFNQLKLDITNLASMDEISVGLNVSLCIHG